jgi:proteasome lid subunit RPN8/RPN11
VNALKIRRGLLRFILDASRATHPKELAGILRKKGDVMEEVLFLPGTLSSDRGAVMGLHMLGIDPSACGTVHSHPSLDPLPSPDDLRFFDKFGAVHLIVAFPYELNSWRAYDHRGNEIEVEVIT